MLVHIRHRKEWKVLTEEPPERPERLLRAPSKLDKLIAQLPPEPALQPPEWWIGQAIPFSGHECSRCSGLTTAEYVAPHDTLGECGVIERCPLCGWECVHLAGRHGRPYS